MNDTSAKPRLPFDDKYSQVYYSDHQGFNHSNKFPILDVIDDKFSFPWKNKIEPLEALQPGNKQKEQSFSGIDPEILRQSENPVLISSILISQKVSEFVIPRMLEPDNRSEFSFHANDTSDQPRVGSLDDLETSTDQSVSISTVATSRSLSIHSSEASFDEALSEKNKCVIFSYLDTESKDTKINSSPCGSDNEKTFGKLTMNELTFEKDPVHEEFKNSESISESQK